MRRAGTTALHDGRLFLLGRTSPTVRTDPRYGHVRVEGDAHPLRVLDEQRRFVPVDDPSTIARVTAQPRRADVARGADGVSDEAP